MPSEITCPRWQQVISAPDTVDSDGYVAHIDCSRPSSLGLRDHVFLWLYCWDHDVAECAAGAQSFRQLELIAEPFSAGTYFCLCCRRDLTESVHAHLLACSTIPEQFRQKVQAVADTTQKLLKQSRQLEGLPSHASAALEAPRHHADALRAIFGAFHADLTSRAAATSFVGNRTR